MILSLMLFGRKLVEERPIGAMNDIPDRKVKQQPECV
jgi:hypothetical protein